MSKSRDAFRTISEVAELLDTPAHVLRFWETKFSQVKPVKRAGGRRYYRPNDVALLAGIRQLLHDDGLTIKGVQKVLREQGVKHVAGIAPPPGLQDETAETMPEAAAAPAPSAEDAAAAPESATVLPFAQPEETEAPAAEEAPAPALPQEPSGTPATGETSGETASPTSLFPETDDPEPHAPLQGALWNEDPEAGSPAAAAPEAQGDATTPERPDPSALPGFVTTSFEERAAAPAAAPIPDLPDLSALPDPAPGPLSRLAQIGRIDAARATELAPHLAALQAFVAARESETPA